MKLLFDARWIRLDYHDGISRYTTELANAVSELDDSVVFLISDERQKTYLPYAHQFILFHGVDSWKEPFSSLLLNRYLPDVVFSPMQTMGAFGRHFKIILTLHDLIYYVHRLPPPTAKGVVRPLWRLFHMTYWPQRFVLNSADTVATVSQTSRREIEAAKLTKRPLIVLSNAARDLSSVLSSPVRQLDTPPQNLVFMGTPLPYKNIETLIQMMKYLPGRTLHVLSKITPARQAELEMLAQTSDKIVFHNGVSDEQYAALLADDAIMVSASKAEGFGLPLAEAMVLGVPAVVSDKSFFHEVGGEGATYANPEDSKAFSEAIKSLDNADLRAKKIALARSHIATFDWTESAQLLLKSATTLSESAGR